MTEETNNNLVSDSDRLIRTFAVGAGAVLSTVIFGVLALLVVSTARSSEDDRIRIAQEATCSKNGMVLLKDKYHPAVCAFEIDDNGDRVAK